MDGEMEERPGQEHVVRVAKQSVEDARHRLDAEKNKSAEREWAGWLTRLRENPILKSRLTRFLGMFLGVPLNAAAAEFPEAPPSDAIVDVSPMYDPDEDSIPYVGIEPESKGELTPIQAPLRTLLEISSRIPTVVPEAPNLPEMMVEYQRNLVLVAQSIENGQAAPEYYARVGRPEWTVYQRSLFANAPVQERFFELHPEYRGLSPQKHLEQFPTMLETARTEFRFSNEYRFLTQDTIELYVAEVASMDPDRALTVYKQLLMDIGTKVGFAHIVTLNEGIAEAVPADHPVRTFITDSGYAELKPIVRPSRSNIIHMDQRAGELRVLARIGDDFILLDSFPAIGGSINTPELSVSGKSAGSEFVHVPETVMKVAYVDRAKTSWSWHNSWVPEGAPIRERGDELQYQHPRTKQWYDLTGPNAAFFPDKDGVTIRPFDEKLDPMDNGLIRAATHGDPASGRVYVPRAWTKDEIIARSPGSEVPTEWKWNDFGSMAARLQTPDGEHTNINIHSKPNQDDNDFLGTRTHGCFATYGGYMQSLADSYGMGSGSTVIVTTESSYDLNQLLAEK